MFWAWIFLLGNPTQFPSVEEMIHEFDDFRASQGEFIVVSKDPLHIQLSPVVVSQDTDEVKHAEVARALVYGVYRSFIHTDIDNITVTAIPLSMDLKSKKKLGYLDPYKKTITLSREKAEKLVYLHTGISEFSELVMKDQYSADARSHEYRLLFEEPYLSRFSKAMIQAGK